MAKYKNRDWLYEQYIVNNRTIKSIYLECNVSHHTIETYLKKFGIRKTNANPKLPTKDELIELYINRGIGVGSIIKLYPDVGVNTIHKLFNDYGIDKLSSSELHKKWWSNPENREIMSDIRLKLWQDDDYYQRTSTHLIDKEAIRDRSIKFSATYQGIDISEWDGFITPERTRVRQSAEYEMWRSSVFERDNYKCQCCGARNGKGRKIVLHAHHIESFANNPDLRFDTNNGITLCYDCHDIRADGSFHNIYGVKNNNRLQLEEYLQYRIKVS